MVSGGPAAPLFGLLQSLQEGGIGDYSVSGVARAIDRSGYDFRHFLAGGVTVSIIEVFVWTAWTLHELSEGKSLTNAMPTSTQRLQGTLFLSHAVATAMKAGRIAATQNPLSVNSRQWLMFFRYILPQALRRLAGRDEAKTAFVQEKLDAIWTRLDAGLSAA